MNLQKLDQLSKDLFFQGKWEVFHNGIWCPNTKIGGHTKILDVRGWGYLTGHGHGAHAMSEDSAIEKQEKLGEYVAMCGPENIQRLIAEAKIARYLSRQFVPNTDYDHMVKQF